jgi:DegV family protein with EDD domain
MKNYVIFTDSCADLTKEMYGALELRCIPLDVIVENEEPVSDDKIDIKEIYAKLRAKQSASTAAINIDRFLQCFENAAKEGLDVLYLGFSSGLSSTYSSSVVVMRELQEKYPENKFYTVDTLCASMGQGLLVYYAANMKKAGASIEEVRDFVENTKLNLCHWFTVDDLFFLKRGGRVSAATAVVGSLLNIKPVLHVDNAGKLINVSKARGRKASIDTMFENMKKSMFPVEQNPTVFISHGDCIADAEYLANRIKTEMGIEDVRINYVGSVIGSHSGPGTLALFFLGNER